MLELTEDARNFRVDQRIKETQAITSDEPIDTFASEIKTNEKIKNRNDYISKTRMALQKGQLKDDYELDPDDKDDLDVEEDTDDDSDQEDEKDNPFKDDKVSDDVFFKYWYCNGKCDSREANEGYNWPANISTRVGYFENLINKLEKAYDKLEKLKEIFYTKKRDMLPLMQIHDAIKLAIASNRKQISRIDPINKIVQQQQKLVSKYMKGGELKEKRGMVIKSTFRDENNKLIKKAVKAVGKLAEYDSAFNNAVKTMREVVLNSYPQKGITLDEDDNEQDLEKDIAESLEILFGIINLNVITNKEELKPFIDSLVVAAKVSKVKQQFKNNPNKEKGARMMKKLEELVNNASVDSDNLNVIEERNNFLNEQFKMSPDLSLKNVEMVKSSTHKFKNRDEALRKYWFCEGKCSYSFDDEDLDWVSNIQQRISYLHEIKEKAVIANKAYKHLLTIYSTNQSTDLDKIETELSEMPDAEVMVGGAETNSLFSDIYAKMQGSVKSSDAEVIATRKLQ